MGDLVKYVIWKLDLEHYEEIAWDMKVMMMPTFFIIFIFCIT